jgi:hypothetical protein
LWIAATEMSYRIELFVGTFSWLFMMALIAATIVAMID